VPLVDTSMLTVVAAEAATDRPATATIDAITFFIAISSQNQLGDRPTNAFLNERLVHDPRGDCHRSERMPAIW
jgi:hypothetical protein